MKKFIFILHKEDSANIFEIYSNTYTEAKKNVRAVTGCKDNEMVLIKEPDTLTPETWLF